MSKDYKSPKVFQASRLRGGASSFREGLYVLSGAVSSQVPDNNKEKQSEYLDQPLDDFIGDDGGRDKGYHIADFMVGKGVSLQRALEATKQHFERRIEAARSARMQEVIAPVFSAAALSAGVAAGAPMSVAQNTVSFSCAIYSYVVCNAEVNKLKNDNRAFLDVYDHIHRIVERDISFESKRKHINQALQFLNFQLEGIKVVDNIWDVPEVGEEDAHVKQFYHGRSGMTRRLDLGEIVDAYEPEDVEVPSGLRAVASGVKDATHGSMEILHHPDKWAHDVSTGNKNAYALAKYAFSKHCSDVYSLWLLKQRVKNKVFTNIENTIEENDIRSFFDGLRFARDRAVESVERLKAHSVNIVSGRYSRKSGPMGARAKKTDVSLRDEDQRLLKEVEVLWSNARLNYSAAKADLTLAGVEACQAFETVAAARTAREDDQILLMFKAAFHGAAVFYSTDAPRFLLRRVSDDTNNLSSQRARDAVRKQEDLSLH